MARPISRIASSVRPSRALTTARWNSHRASEGCAAAAAAYASRAAPANPFASQTMPNRPQREPSRGSCATPSRAWRTRSSISGASGPRLSSAGGAGALPRNVRIVTAAAAAHTIAARPIAIKRRRGERRWARLGIGEERRVRGTRPGEAGDAAAEEGAVPSPAPLGYELPVELDAEPPQPRRHDRRRLQEGGSGTPVDVLRGV